MTQLHVKNERGFPTRVWIQDRWVDAESVEFSMEPPPIREFRADEIFPPRRRRDLVRVTLTFLADCMDFNRHDDGTSTATVYFDQ